LVITIVYITIPKNPVMQPKANEIKIMDKMNDHSEKRDFDRFSIELEIEVSGKDSAGKIFREKTVLKDASGGGVSFLSRSVEYYSAGQLLELTIFLPGAPNLFALFVGAAKVVRIIQPTDPDLKLADQIPRIAVKLDNPMQFTDKTVKVLSDETKVSKEIKDDKEMDVFAGKLKNADRELREQSVRLMQYAKDVSLYNNKLQAAYRDIVYRFVIAAEYYDEDTSGHIMRMGRYCALLSEKLGLPSSEVQSIKYAAPLHDAGKIGIPDRILTKRGKLSEKEFEIMKTHTIIGSNVLSNSEESIIQTAQKIALSHHEKWNGMGYPYGLSEEKIDLAGRIVCLADSFDALISKRPYRNPYPLESACDIISVECGKQFDPQITDIFLNNIDEFTKIKKEVDSSKRSLLSEFSLE
jgi:response regulator RpfG family c-di-GMP phosphodiesterase